MAKLFNSMVGDCYGKVGKKSPFFTKDHEFRVGDMVRIISLPSELPVSDLSFIVKTKECGFFVMGIQMSTSGKSGDVFGNWKIQLVKPYDQVSPDEYRTNRDFVLKKKGIVVE